MKTTTWFIIGVGALLALGIGWWLASPLFLNKTVDEAQPFAEMTSEEYQAMQDAVLPIGMDLPPMEEMMEMSAEDMAALEREMLERSEETETAPMEEPMQSGPTLTFSGMFEDADNFHMGSGNALVYTDSDGSRLLRLEDFEVTNGPDLFVVLSKHPQPDARALGDYVNLGRLKGNRGNQNYEIPDSVNVDEYKSVVIYCRAFHTVFATATLQ